jgi:cytochrome c biogenesis protein
MSSDKVRNWIDSFSLWMRRFLVLLGSMRFAIALLTLICVASVMGSVVEQNQPWVNYVNQFGVFWAGFFQYLGLFQIYNTRWFVGVMFFLVLSTSLCVYRNAPKMLREMRVFQEGIREASLNAFSHRWAGRFSETEGEMLGFLSHSLKAKGYPCRVQQRGHGTLLAGKSGGANRLGYIATHLAIVVICVGGMLDSGLPLRWFAWLENKEPITTHLGVLADVPEKSRMGADNPSYRASVLLPEGQSSGVALLNTGNGVLVQDLPFELTLKAFQVEFYSTGMPKVFASEVAVFDQETQTRFSARIEVNKPLHYKGVTVYQSSFDDGGSQLTLKAYPLRGLGSAPVVLSGVVGSQVDLLALDQPDTLELSGFKSLSVEQMPVDEALLGQASGFMGVLGAGVRTHQATKPRNLGPSVTYKVRDPSGQAREFHSLMLPVELDGARYFLAGVRNGPTENFKYLRLPADAQGGLDELMRLRAALQNEAIGQEAARRFAARTLQDRDKSALLQARVAESAKRTLDRFVEGGLGAIAQFIEQTVPQPDRENASEVIARLLQSVLWEVYQLSREQAALAPAELGVEQARFVQDALVALSDLPLYDASWLFQLSDFQEVKASVFQVSKAPGQGVVYVGCVLLIVGVFAMFYIRARRIFFWITPHKEGGSHVLMAFSTTRTTLDSEHEFQRFVQELSAHSVRGDV